MSLLRLVYVPNTHLNLGSVVKDLENYRTSPFECDCYYLGFLVTYYLVYFILAIKGKLENCTHTFCSPKLFVHVKVNFYRFIFYLNLEQKGFKQYPAFVDCTYIKGKASNTNPSGNIGSSIGIYRRTENC